MIALARKYRPKRFSDLIVQEHIAAVLRGAVAGGRVAHGYLFAGPRGVGKTTAARILAMALNCERPPGTPAGEPCGKCDSCQRVWNGQANLDVVELDAASNRGVDDARDLRERAMYAASTESGSKVYIVDEAHMLTREAWNALLKILEEPPPRVVFVFATTEPQKIANTAAPILSRLQRFDFRRIGPHAIVSRLKQVAAAEQLKVEDDALHLIARSANGGMRDALSLLEQVLSFGEGPVTAARVREVLGLIPDELYAEMLRAIAERDPAAVFPLVERLLEAGADLAEFVNGAGEALRALLLVGVGGQPEGLTEGLMSVVREYAPKLPPADIVRLLTILSDSEERLSRSANQRLLVEVLLLRWAMLDRTVELSEVLEALKGVGQSDGWTERTPPTSVRPSDRPTVRPTTVRPSHRSEIRTDIGERPFDLVASRAGCPCENPATRQSPRGGGSRRGRGAHRYAATRSRRARRGARTATGDYCPGARPVHQRSPTRGCRGGGSQRRAHNSCRRQRGAPQESAGERSDPERRRRRIRFGVARIACQQCDEG